jgi:hypothetical protein
MSSTDRGGDNSTDTDEALPRLPLTLLRQLLQAPTLELTLKKEWGSENKAYRKEIRQALSTQFDEDFSDLEKRPTSVKKAISISHCPQLGGFATIVKPGSIGLDIEVEARVEKKIAARMSTTQEMNEAPSPAHLWAAKEAAYKSLGDVFQPGAPPGALPEVQPNVLSSVEIGDWVPVTLHDPSTNEAFALWKFRAQCLENGRLRDGQGVVFTHTPLIFSLFARTTST